VVTGLTGELTGPTGAVVAGADGVVTVVPTA